VFWGTEIHQRVFHQTKNYCIEAYCDKIEPNDVLFVLCWTWDGVLLAKKGGGEGSTFKWLLLTSCSNRCSQSPSSCAALEEILLRWGSAFQEDKVIPVSLFKVNNNKPLQPSLAFQEHSMIVTSIRKIKNANHYRQDNSLATTQVPNLTLKGWTTGIKKTFEVLSTCHPLHVSIANTNRELVEKSRTAKAFQMCVFQLKIQKRWGDLWSSKCSQLTDMLWYESNQTFARPST
jgi:hypothetical protein